MAILKAKLRRLQKNITQLHVSRRTAVILVTLSLVVTAVFAYAGHLKSGPLVIGVLLPLSGPDAGRYPDMVRWLEQAYAEAAGEDAKELEFIYKDVWQADVVELARSLVEDPRINVVIGPARSGDLMQIAPMFIEKKKLLISPGSTAADIYRAFAGQDYIWRTVQSDVAQIRTIIHELQKQDVSNIALIYDPSTYGKTFYEWTGFFATEANMTLSSIQAVVVDNPDYEELITTALQGGPEYIISVTYPTDTVELKRELDRHETTTKLFLTDSSQKEYVLTELGDAAEGLESTGIAFDPQSGFSEAYSEFMQSNEEPYGFTATVFDAGALAILAALRHDIASPLPPFFQEDISYSFKQLVYSEAAPQSPAELSDLIAQVKSGKLPKYKGYSGSLDFDRDSGVDPLDSFYAYQMIRNGHFETDELIYSGAGGELGVYAEGGSVITAIGSLEYAALTDRTAELELAERKSLKAVIVASSAGWSNYRHQSDAAAMYQLLRRNGVRDDGIILFMVDDVPHSHLNNPQPSLFHTADGEDNYAGIRIDYSGEQVTEANLARVLMGIKTPETPVVLETDENTNILLYIVDHGGDLSALTAQAFGGDFTDSSGFITFDHHDQGEQLELAGHDFQLDGRLTSEELGNIVSVMTGTNSLRQMLIVVEACFSGSMAQKIDHEGVLFMSAASASEVSYGANYHPGIRQWLANQFTYQFVQEAARNSTQSIADFYHNVYRNVPGSHVTLLNYQNFGAVKATSISEFLSP